MIVATNKDDRGAIAAGCAPGVGRILAMTMLYEIHDIRRFPKVGDFLS